MLLLISYDQTDAARPQQFDRLESTLTQGSTAITRPSYSTWLIETPDDVQAWGQRMEAIMTPQDRVLITRIPNAASINGWLPRANWDWINEHTT